MIVTTPRLDRVPLPLPLLEALVDGDLAAATALAPYPVDERAFAGDELVLRLRRDQLRADPTELPWLYRAGVLRATGRVVARGGFHAPPDDEGAVELGYRVSPDHRGQGLATELADGLISWARAQGVRRVVASVSPATPRPWRSSGGWVSCRRASRWTRSTGSSSSTRWNSPDHARYCLSRSAARPPWRRRLVRSMAPHC